MSDDRAVSTTINYVLGLAIAFALVTGLLIAGGDFVQNQREDAARTELRVLGEQVTSDLMTADRLAETTRDNETVNVERDLPDSVAGSGYTVTVTGGTDPYLVLETTSPDVEVEVELSNRTDVDMANVNGGPIVVRYDGDSLVLESDS